MKSSRNRIVILPSYNSGSLLVRTAREARTFWSPIWVVVDGSTDGSASEAEALGTDGFRVLRLEKNCGKGGAVLHALQAAQREGITHALVMDADGQHAAASIPFFMKLSEKNPECLIAGVPVFGPDAPVERVKGRRVGNFFSRLETLGLGPQDSLFGFRVYPVIPALNILENTRTARRFDFDTVLAVRLTWTGVRTINYPVPVRYPPRLEGGVTHFRYLHDNLLLVAAHTRLLIESIPHIPHLLSFRNLCR